MAVTKIMFKCHVVGTLLTGLEAEVLTQRDYEAMERRVMQLGRKACGSGASRQTGDGSRHGKTNEQIRKLLGIATMKSELQHRRAKWWQHMLENPDHYAQMRAAVFGRLQLEVDLVIDRATTNPWAAQCIDDLDALARTHGLTQDIRETIQREGVGAYSGEG